MLESFVRTFHEDVRGRGRALHPSSFKGCHRQTIYQYLQIEPDREYTEEELRVFATGYMVEDFVLRAFEHDGILAAKGMPIRATYDGIGIVGKTDAILHVNGKLFICDVKATNSWGLAHYNSYPYEHHLTQIGLYAWADKQMGVDQVTDGVSPSLLLYIGRDDLSEERCYVGKEAEAQALDELDQVVGYIKLDVIPGRPFDTPEDHPWLCAKCVDKGSKRDGRLPTWRSSCIYFNRCWKVEGKGVQYQWNYWAGEGPL